VASSFNKVNRTLVPFFHKTSLYFYRCNKCCLSRTNSKRKSLRGRLCPVFNSTRTRWMPPDLQTWWWRPLWRTWPSNRSSSPSWTRRVRGEGVVRDKARGA